MAISKFIKEKRVARIISEINDAAFIWYLLFFVIVFLVDLWMDGILTKLGVSKSAVGVFVGVSGILKLAYRFEDIESRINKLVSDCRHRQLIERMAVRLLAKVILIIKVRVLKRQTFIVRMPAIIRATFSFLFVLYLVLLVGEEFQDRWAEVYLHFRTKILFYWVIATGVVSVLMRIEDNNKNQQSGSQLQWTTILEYSILSIGGGLVIYFKVKDLGWVGVAMSFIVAALIFYFSLLIHENINNNDEY